MNTRQLGRGFTISTVALLGLLLSNALFSAERADRVGSMGPVPKAECGPS